MLGSAVSVSRLHCILLNFNRKLFQTFGFHPIGTLRASIKQHIMMSSSAKPKVLVTREDFPVESLKLLADFEVRIWPEKRSMTRDELLKWIPGNDAIIVDHNKVNDEYLDVAGPQLKVIATISVGYDHIDVAAVKKRNVRIGHTPGVLDDSVAELVIAVMLAFMRRLFEGRDAVINGQWPKYQGLFWMNGMGLNNSVVGIIGLGRIGLGIARRLVPFKVKEILYTSRQEKREASEFSGKKVEMNELLQKSDIVIVMCALCPETYHLIGEEQLKMMKPTAIIVNGARGDVLDQEALVRALTEGVIRGAALDVTSPEPLPPDHPLLSLPNCCVVPHLGSAVVETRQAMCDMTARNIVAGLAGEPMPGELL